MIGEETQRLIEAATSQVFSMKDSKEESLSPMDVEETIENKDGKDEKIKDDGEIVKPADLKKEEEKENDK